MTTEKAMAALATDEAREAFAPLRERASTLINRAQVRRRLIEHAADTRFYWRSVDARVSSATLDRIEAVVSREIRAIVERLPSTGKTI